MKKRFRPHLWFVSVVSRIVPRRFRSDWMQEWEAELSHRESLLEEWRRLDAKTRRHLFRQSLASFWDALAMQPRRLEEEFVQDLRFGIRMLLRNKGVTAVALISLALGIGANTALFSVFDAMMLRKLPVQAPEQLVLFNWTYPEDADFKGGLTFDGTLRDPESGLATWDSFSYRTFEQFRTANQTLSDLFAFARIYRINVVANGSGEIGDGEYVSGSYFGALGMKPALGRWITADDDMVSAAPIAVISHKYWKQRFGLDSAVIGENVIVNHVSLTIVGVAPPEFTGTLQVNDSPDLYIPIAMEPAVSGKNSVRASSGAASSSPDVTDLKQPSQWWLQIMGRMKPGATIEKVRANFEGAFNQAAAEVGGDYKGRFEAPRLQLKSGSKGLYFTRDGFAEPLMILTLIVGLVLLIACANVANLLLARMAVRQRECATRLALGATRLRLIRQLLTESVLLASIGGLLGVAIAYWGKDLLLLRGPWTQPTSEIGVSMNLRVLGFALAVSVLTGLLFGLAPAIQAMRRDLKSGIPEQARTMSPKRSRLSKSLVMVQVAMSVVLLVGAGLFLRTLRNLHHVDVGFDPVNLLLFSVDPRLNSYDAGQFQSAMERIAEKIKGIDGVVAVTASHHTLAGARGNSLSNTEPDGTQITASYVGVRPNFFETLRLPVVLGRSFTFQDDAAAPGVAVVNETFAKRYFPKGDMLGKKIWGREIVGVVRDAKYRNLRESIPPVIYWPYLQDSARGLTFELRITRNTSSLIRAVREAVHEIDRNLPVDGIRTQDEVMQETIRRERMFASLSTAFGSLSLFLVCVGLYGVMSNTVVRRTHEIGIRMALGARRSKVIRMVMWESLVPVVAGVLAGIAGAFVLRETIAGILFQLAPHDPATLLIAALVMIAVGTLAGYLPARRASRVDPTTALRYE